MSEKLLFSIFLSRQSWMTNLYWKRGINKVAAGVPKICFRARKQCRVGLQEANGVARGSYCK
jgi:hypothetical protein